MSMIGAKRHWYTVILLYPDFLTDDFGADIYTDWCLGETPEDAARVCQEKAAKAQNDGPVDIVDDPTVFRPIAVIAGKRMIVADATSF
jgi:hypothetical protein